MEINGVTYTDVAVVDGRKYEQPRKSEYQTKTVESDAKLYYQTKKGILKIEMEDGSYIAINEEDD
jgi:frataxin-like iron-binding protein CyaY